MRKLLILVVAAVIVTSSSAWYLNGVSSAQTAEQGDFSLQVTPSPLVSTVKPGQSTEIEMQVRNAGTTTEELKIEPRAFTFNDATGEVTLQDTTPPDIGQWMSFSNPTFIVQPGAWFTQKIRISLPKDSGFSYSFALVISRTKTPAQTGARVIKGSLAVFTLVNVDRPGASSKLDIMSFSADKKVYEYLPTELSIRLKNSGNTIVQPYGNIFIQRGASSTPISTLKVNETKGYILPGTSRTLSTQWTDGFPSYQTVTENGKEKQKLTWNWAKAADFRLGRYTAKLVAVYNDGQRDVPINGEVSFWIIPWKILLGMFLFALLALAGLWSLVHRVIKIFRRGKAKSTNSITPVESDTSEKKNSN